MDTIHYEVVKLQDQVISWRRWMHQHAELSFEEVKTSAYIEQQLRSFGNIEISRPTQTSVLGVLKGAKDGKTVALRADIDALPMREDNDLPFRSQNDGAMHSCGHDGHAAIVLGAAKVLSEHVNEICGEIRFIFQHAEEAPPGGGIEILRSGILDDVDEVFGLHLVSVLPTGVYGVKEGALTSSTDGFTICVKGKGGHSSMPYDCIDPVTIGAEIIMALQTILSRRIRALDSAVLSICQVNAGSAYNIIPNDLEMKGSVRTYSTQVRQNIKLMIENIAEGIAKTHGAAVEFEYTYGYGSVINDPILTKEAVSVLSDAFGEKSVRFIEPMMPGDDFSYYHTKCPGFFLEIGTGNPQKGMTAPHHNPNYLMDEDALTPAVEYVVKMLKKRMGF